MFFVCVFLYFVYLFLFVDSYKSIDCIEEGGSLYQTLLIYILFFFSTTRYLIRTSVHPLLVSDSDFIEFLEKEGDLPKATSTSALSGAGMMRLFHKVGESLEKITLKVDESDEVSLIPFFCLQLYVISRRCLIIERSNAVCHGPD